MFDFHIHSRVSFDGHDSGLSLALAAKEKGLQEICFTDHYDRDPLAKVQTYIFDPGQYRREYDALEVPELAIRRGMEFGMLPDNRQEFSQVVQQYPYDFVLGSVHFVDGLDVYFREYWQGKTLQEAEQHYYETVLTCLQMHEDLDVLAHLNFISKAAAHPTREGFRWESCRDLIEEILRELVRKGKGLELNTSGIAKCGDFLPPAVVFRRFKELGGQIVTVGSDAHRCDRVGDHIREACEILKDIFGYVCTFEERKPIFHKL